VQIGQTKKDILEECQRIKTTFSLKILEIEKGQAERVIRFHQLSLIILINEIAKIKIESSLSELFQFSCDQLEGLIGFIQHSYLNYFDRDANVPDPIKDRVFKAIKESSILLEDELGKFKIDNNLFAACTNVMSEFLKGHDHKITYRTMHCIKELMTELIEVSHSYTDVESLTGAIQTVLLQLNYNHPSYIKYCINLINKALLESDTLSGKLEILAFHYKVINQSYVRPGFIFDLTSPSLKEHLSKWILEEMEYIEHKQRLSMSFPSSTEDQVKKDFKLVFDMSVSQFAFLIKTLTEIGVIQNKNTSELIRFLSKFVKTKRSESISYESFRIKYYNAEDNTKGAVRNLLHTAIGFINNH
jgi:hypothetical protein